MRREEKRRRFNEAVVDMLFPQPPPPPQVLGEEEEEEENEPVNILREDFDTNLIPDDLEESGSSACDDTDSESGPRRKLTRAQRKRLRKKKLKEDASRRGNIVGPLLRPSTSESEGGDVETERPDVRRNAAEKKVDATAANSGEEAACACANQKKLKHRRMAKRLAKDRLKPSNLENCSQNDQPLADQNVGST